MINKYFDNGRLLPVKSNQKTNKYLKELCKLAGFERLENVFSYSGNRIIETVLPRHELIATHTARRTFVTLSAKKGMPPLHIMSITGHTNYETFMKYYKIDALAVKDSFLNAWDNINPIRIEIARNLKKQNIDLNIIANATGISLDKIKEL